MQIFFTFNKYQTEKWLDIEIYAIWTTGMVTSIIHFLFKQSNFWVFVDYDGYDDIYGHSVDDDYCISPSNRQYLYNRESSTRSSESDIKEEDELEAQLPDIERAKLESCIDQIKSTIGALNLNRNQLVNIIVSQNYNIEKCINAILEENSVATDVKEKGEFCQKRN